MSLVESINFFSSYGADECYILTKRSNKYYINKNYSIDTNICTVNLSDGIYFEVLSGNLNNTSDTNQFFSIKVKNPTSLNLSSTYKVVFYNTSSQPVSSYDLNGSIDGIEVSYQATNQPIAYIALFSGNKVIYSSEDWKNNLIPLNQKFTVSYYDDFGQYLSETYLFRNKYSGLYFSDPSYRTVYSYSLSTPISSNNPILLYNGINIGSKKINILSEFKIPSQYRFLDNTTKYSLTTYSILSYLFTKDVLKSLNNDIIEDWPFYNSLEKANNVLPYERYYFDESQINYVPINRKVNIVDILLALYISSSKQALLLNSYNIHTQILQFLKTFSLNNDFYPMAPVPSNNASILPDEIFFDTNTNQFNSPSSYSLGTNLLFLSILNSNFEDIDPLIREIERVFLQGSVIKWTVSEIKQNVEDVLQAAIIKTFLNHYRLFFNNSYQNTIDQIINDATQFLINSLNVLSKINIDTNVNSTTYNPIYDLNVDFIHLYTDEIYKNIYISFFLGEDLGRYLSISIDKGPVLDSTTYDQTKYKLILPSLRATLALYQLSFISVYKREVIPDKNDVLLINHDTKLAGNLLISNVEFSVPVKIIALLKVNNQVVSYFVSPSSSILHNIQFSSSLLSSSNYNIEIYILKD